MTPPEHRGSAPGVHHVVTAGEPLSSARAVMIMVHGRGATADDILGLRSHLPQDGVAFLAPQAAGSTWYPHGFLAPIASNEPWLSASLDGLGELLRTVAAAGLGADRTMLLGFSQGACLTVEFAARNAARLGGIVALTGGLIGPPGTPRDYPGAFDGTPVLLGSSDVDPHVPEWRVRETAEVLARMGARVTTRIYPGMGHSVNADELTFVGDMVAEVARASGDRSRG